jgi:hypothetical protein
MLTLMTIHLSIRCKKSVRKKNINYKEYTLC